MATARSTTRSSRRRSPTPPAAVGDLRAERRQGRDGGAHRGAERGAARCTSTTTCRRAATSARSAARRATSTPTSSRWSCRTRRSRRRRRSSPPTSTSSSSGSRPSTSCSPFRTFDEDHSGYIGREELEHGIQHFNMTIPHEQSRSSTSWTPTTTARYTPSSLHSQEAQSADIFGRSHTERNAVEDPILSFPDPNHVGNAHLHPATPRCAEPVVGPSRHHRRTISALSPVSHHRRPKHRRARRPLLSPHDSSESVSAYSHTHCHISLCLSPQKPRLHISHARALTGKSSNNMLLLVRRRLVRAAAHPVS